MTTVDWVNLLALGVLCGAIGQAVRIVAGLKKLSDETGGMNGMRAAIVPSQLIISVLIGGTAGALAAISLPSPPSTGVDVQSITTLLGAGYAGADFIEAFMKKATPRTQR
jgi:hypothetical protein